MFNVADGYVAKIVYRSLYDASFDEAFTCDTIQDINSALIPKMKSVFVGGSCAIIRRDISEIKSIVHLSSFEIKAINSHLNSIPASTLITSRDEDDLIRASELIINEVNNIPLLEGFRHSKIFHEIYNVDFIKEILKLTLNMNDKGISLRDLSVDNIGYLDGQLVIRDFSRCKADVPMDYSPKSLSITKVVDSLKAEYKKTMASPFKETSMAF